MLTPILVFTILALVLALIIVFADKNLSVKENLKVKKLTSILPGINCGACGFPSCDAFAQALVVSMAKSNSCIPGGATLVSEIAELIGENTVTATIAKTAKIHCKGGQKEAKERAIYDGISNCFAATLIANGSKECSWGCLGFGSCLPSCPFDAIYINKNGIAAINEEKCIGCGACLNACPRKLISITPEAQKIFVACNNHEKGDKVKDYCTVGCTACAICTKSVIVEKSIEMQSNLPRLNYNTEENFILAKKKCPQNCFSDLAKGRPIANIGTTCNGCEKCIKTCPVKGAIVGEPGKRHNVNKNLCIGCGRCISVCDIKAIKIWGALGYNQGARSSQNMGHYR